VLFVERPVLFVDRPVLFVGRPVLFGEAPGAAASASRRAKPVINTADRP